MSSIYSNFSVHGPGDVVVDVNHQVSLLPQVELPHSVEFPQPSYQVELPLQDRIRFRNLALVYYRKGHLVVELIRRGASQEHW